MEISFFVAFAGGLLSFLSPCVLPLVPAYLAFMAGASFADLKSGTASKKKTLLGALSFVLGFTIAFIAVGLFLSEIISRYIGAELFMKFAGILLLVFGMHTAGIYRIKWLMFEARMHSGGQNLTYIGSFVLGLTFALGWSPCIGPILSAILSLASTAGGELQAAALMAAYSFGLGVPFLLASLLTEKFIEMSGSLKAKVELFEKISGYLIIAVAVGMIFISSHAISGVISDLFPSLENMTNVESSLVK